MQDTLSCPLLLKADPPASHQQIAHALGHPPEPGLMEPLLGLESPARPGFERKPAGMFLDIYNYVHMHKLNKSK